MSGKVRDSSFDKKPQKTDHYQTAYQALSPLYKMSKLLALSPYERKEDGTYGRSIRRLILCVIYTCIFATSLFVNMTIMASVVKADSTILYLLLLFDTCGNIVVMFCMWLLSHLSVKREIRYLEQIEAIDAILASKYNKQIALSAGNRLLYRISWVIILFIFIVYYACVEAILVNKVFKEFDMITTFIRFMPTAVTTAVEVNFYAVTTLLRDRLKIINQMLDESVAESEKVMQSGNSAKSYPPNAYRFETDIEALLDLHKQLTDLAKAVNASYGIQLLLTFTILFVLVIGDSYVILFSIIVGQVDIWYVMYSAMKLVIYHSFEMLMLIRSSSVICYEANRTKDILLAIKISPENVDSRNLIMASVLQLMYNKLEITALKFFNVDYNLLFSMFAAMTTYLLIMLQFDVEDK